MRALSLPACNGKGPGTEDCHVRVFVDPARCGAGHPCDRLVVYWAGGEQSCAQGNYDKLMRSYVDDGFVAVCAQAFTTGAEAGRYPYHLEHDRMTEIMAQVRQQPEVKAGWDGRRLLISGVSHGATAPLAAIGSRFALGSPLWVGTVATAVVLYDGISNVALLDEWTSRQPNCAAWHRRFVERYGDGQAPAHSCKGGPCYCASPSHAADWRLDTLTIGATVPPSPYTCANFSSPTSSVLYRFVSCQGVTRKDPCGPVFGDIVPDEQQRLPAEALQRCPGMKVSYDLVPGCPHILCGAEKCGRASAMAWLKSQGW